MVNLKRLGNTGVFIPEIGLGTWNYRGGVEPLRRGIELGASLIDTAEGYGTEGVVGEAIAGIRDRVFVATKVSGRHLGYDDVIRACEGSVKRLGIDRIDLYQVHWFNPEFPLKGTMRAMERLADAGLIKYIGVSNFDLDTLRLAESYMRNYAIVSNQVLYNLSSRGIERSLAPYCEERGITIIAYTPLDGGGILKKSCSLPMSGALALERIAAEVGKTPAQVALNWCIAHTNVVAIPKSNGILRTEENVGGSGWRLSRSDMERLEIV
ncbi:MAG: aldo/keto reductase [Deltaproteobacteria bacterium]